MLKYSKISYLLKQFVKKKKEITNAISYFKRAWAIKNTKTTTGKVITLSPWVIWAKNHIIFCKKNQLLEKSITCVH